MGNLCGPSALHSVVTSSCLGPLVPSRDLPAFLQCFVRERTGGGLALDPRNRVCFIVAAGGCSVA